jgi:molecular chaperone Hsp33
MLGVHLQPAAPYVAAAGGLMIQMMPGADEKTINAIEANLSRMPQATAMIRDGARPEDLLRAALGELEFEKLDEKEVRFACPCSYERAVSMISSIDPNELEAMLREDKGVVMTCHFCNESYRLNEEELQRVMSETK